MKKFSHPFMQLLVMAGISLFLMLVASFPMVVLAFAGVDFEARMPSMIMLAAVQAATFLLPPVLMVQLYYSGEKRSFWRFDFSCRKWLLALAGVVVMLLFSPLNDWLATWNGSWDFGLLDDRLRTMQELSETQMKSMLDVTSVSGLLFNLLVVAVVPAVCEEAFFRVGIQNLMHRWTGNIHAAIWITAALFSVVHFEAYSFMPRFLMGALLGYLFVYGGSFVVNASAHFVNNAVVVALYWLSARGIIGIDMASPLGLNPMVTICCTLAAVVLFVVAFAKNLKISR